MYLLPATMLQGDQQGYVVASGHMQVENQPVRWQVDHNNRDEWQVSVWVCGNLYGPSPYVEATTKLHELACIVEDLALEYMHSNPDLCNLPRS